MPPGRHKPGFQAPCCRPGRGCRPHLPESVFHKVVQILLCQNNGQAVAVRPLVGHIKGAVVLLTDGDVFLHIFPAPAQIFCNSPLDPWGVQRPAGPAVQGDRLQQSGCSAVGRNSVPADHQLRGVEVHMAAAGRHLGIQNGAIRVANCIAANHTAALHLHRSVKGQSVHRILKLGSERSAAE